MFRANVEPARALLSVMGRRAHGHTFAAVQAARASGALIVCATEQHAATLRRYGVNAVSAQQPDALLGRSGPMLVDNFAVTSIFEPVLRELDELRAYNAEVRQKYETERAHSERLEEEIERMKRGPAVLKLPSGVTLTVSVHEASGTTCGPGCAHHG